MRSQRPGFAPGYGVTDSDDGLVAWHNSQERLAASRNYWIATADEDGVPHSAPVWGVWIDDRLYFGTDVGSKKAANLSANPRAIVHLESGDDVVILDCAIDTVSDQGTIDLVFETYRDKYSMPADFVFSPVLAARPTGGFAWLEEDFPNTATKYVP